MTPIDSELVARAPEAALAASARERAAQRRIVRSTTAWTLICLGVDGTMLAAAGAASELASPSAGVPSSSPAWVALFALLVLAVLAARGLYRPRLRLQALDDVAVVLLATLVVGMALISMRVLVGDSDDVADQTLRLWTFAAVYLSAGRAAIYWSQARARRAGEAGVPTLIVGAGRVGRLTAKRLLDEPELGLRPVGFLDKDPLTAEPGGPRLPIVGASWDLEQAVERYGIEHVIVAFSTAPHHVLLGITERCEALGVAVSFVPRLFEKVPRRMTVDHLGGLPLLTVHAVNPKGWHFAVKYAADRALAALLLVLTAALLAASALAVWATMGRPVIYRQRRVGLDGREFGMLKFRTMLGTPEENGEADAGWASAQLSHAPADDSPSVADRRTPVGRILRMLSLDELPQLWNVLVGDMSLVGPRPERTHYARRFEEHIYRYADRHRVKSGITGWAQVNGLRGETSLADRVEWDNYYIENWSLWLDAKVLLLTALAVFRTRERV